MSLTTRWILHQFPSRSSSSFFSKKSAFACACANLFLKEIFFWFHSLCVCFSTVCTHKHRHPPAPCEQGFSPENVACLSVLGQKKLKRGWRCLCVPTVLSVCARSKTRQGHGHTCLHPRFPQFPKVHAVQVRKCYAVAWVRGVECHPHTDFLRDVILVIPDS